MSGGAVSVRPILAADIDLVSEFLHANLNPRVTSAAWSRLFRPPWGERGPNHGFLLEHEHRLVGVYAAVYAERDLGSGPQTICNLGAFCVLDEHRLSALRLVRALLAQKGFGFTDLSPSGNVVALNERLGFRHLEVSCRLVPNLPWPRRSGITLTSDPGELERTLHGVDASAYVDHVGTAARHLLVREGSDYGYLVFRKDRRKRLPWFATPLFAGGNPALLERAWRQIGSHLLVGHGMPFTLAETRVLGFAPRPGRELRVPRPRMVRGDAALDRIDYLYSELALVQW